MRTKAISLTLFASLILAAPAYGLAGGATGSGGGGGGGGGSSGGGGYYGGGSVGSGSWGFTETIIFVGIMLLVFGIPLLSGLINKARRQWYRDRILRRARKVEKA